MATWDSADLLQRVKDKMLRPSTDAVFGDTLIYRALTEGEAKWKRVLAAHYPHDMFSAPAICVDGGDQKTYTLPSSETNPLIVELLTTATGRPLKPGPYWDRSSDYVLERGLIRITDGRSMTFEDGAPYARIVSAPGDIDASTDSTIFPTEFRILIVLHACAQLARSGMGLGDPSFFEDAMDEAAWGNPSTGDVGLIGGLKRRDSYGGLAGIAGDGTFRWWRPNG